MDPTKLPLAPAPYDLAPVATILGIGGLVALAVAGWAWRRTRGIADPAARSAARRHALAVLTLWLTFDLVLFGAFTRLSDSGLGCPDWPGCYAAATPIGARAAIDAAAAAAPTGPVTSHKAWIEMVHRYLATGVGGLLVVATVAGWSARRRRTVRPRPKTPGTSPWWPTAGLAWVAVQGAFGAWTVTLKLFPLIVTAHLLGGLVLLALLAAQVEAGGRGRFEPLVLPSWLRKAAAWLAAASLLQIALGAWVSTNVAVLACSDFPSCQGSLWPAMDFPTAFQAWHPLGRRADGTALPFAALTAIHYTHRLGAYVVLVGMVFFASALAWRAGTDRERRRWAGAVAGVAAWQLATGLSNVLLDAPLLAALGHTAGAAAWVLVITRLLMRAGRPRTDPAPAPAAAYRRELRLPGAPAR